MPVLKGKYENIYIIRRFMCVISPKMKVFPPAQRKNRYRSASLTAEAALAFPVFFFTVYMLWQLFLLLLFQMQVCQVITETAIQYAHLGYPERKAQEKDVDISWLYQPLLWNALPENDRVENMRVLCIPQEDGIIQVDVGYQFACESVFYTKFSFPVRQKFQFYPYLGETDEDLFASASGSESNSGTSEETDIVYMTEYGKVYHESRACSYLNVVVRSVAASAVEEERNSSGRKYKPCERCDDREATGTVYISAGGEKYHLAASCPALKRTVTEKSREEVEGVPACHKCGNHKGEKEN